MLEPSEITKDVSAGSTVAARMTASIVKALGPQMSAETYTQYRRKRAEAVAALLIKARHLVEEDPLDKAELETFGQKILTGELVMES